jgi:hypothetical protein
MSTVSRCLVRSGSTGGPRRATNQPLNEAGLAAALNLTGGVMLDTMFYALTWPWWSALRPPGCALSGSML